ncbi:MAG: FAD-dependent pyridine nucleotide-disulfide oxidoreductase [Hydrogenibacillus schlegelii]|uniref:FAD-dependent pyridine nucleotide-disulfide oxidoreductase n=1 Tax=Hydrogenibacillus schlegelii TaxID=1484 RepID=A0A2T5GBQ2_HYDSH|nr:FAD/NAD(P)-binding oxidoreductase [Hydrogenibacillus schlegelii]PTQ53596.1 MAG: FAD-dependent pyridine nucleotide-disulfide oxidoreductase [Hydrogenibacillus schlegelii]
MRFKIVIVGGGTGGITVAAQLLRRWRALSGEIAIVEPSEKHYYQPLWTLVGAGITPLSVTVREEERVIPPGAVWIRDAVELFLPGENRIVLKSGESIAYDWLVVAAGLQLDWDKIDGIREALESGTVGSNYAFDTVEKTWNALKRFEGGMALFTAPNTPVKCGGAPQKIMYLAEDSMRRKGVRAKATVRFVSGGTMIFSVPKFAATLNRIVRERNIETHFRHNLVALDPVKQEAIFENLESGDRVRMPYDFLHVVPPQSAPDFIKESPLADAAGWVDVDMHTLQHKRYPNVFGIGDNTNLPTARTGAAIRKQAPVLVHNLLAAIRGEPLSARYNGYASCPLVTGYGRLMLAEFVYGDVPNETFPFDQAKERFSMYVLKKELLPIIYWDGMLKGVM